jgi:molecular chaperone DnaK
MVSPFRGTNQLTRKNQALGQFQIVGIPPAPRGTPQIEVTFSITEKQILMSARNVARNSDLEIRKASGETTQ